MRKLFIASAAFILAFALNGKAQNKAPEVIPDGYELVDSLVYTPLTGAYKEIADRNIFSLVDVQQSPELRAAAEEKIKANSMRAQQGWRIRIFFDGSQDGRNGSSAAMAKFKRLYPGVPVYKTFERPAFIVAAGDFRTKADAAALFQRVKEDFPAAMMVKAKISFPAIGSEVECRIDTVKVLRPIAQ